MNSSILPSIQSKIPLTWLKPILEDDGDADGDGLDTCAADIEWNGMKWNGIWNGILYIGGIITLYDSNTGGGGGACLFR